MLVFSAEILLLVNSNPFIACGTIPYAIRLFCLSDPDLRARKYEKRKKLSLQSLTFTSLAFYFWLISFSMTIIEVTRSDIDFLSPDILDETPFDGFKN